MSLIKELTREPTIDLVRFIIAYYIKKYNRGVKAEVLVKLLFLVLYTDEKGLIDSPRVRLPEEFRIYLKGPFVPIDRLLGGELEMSKYGIAKVGDSYYINVNALEDAYRSLEKRGGLKDLADYAMRVVDKYGALREEVLINLTLEILGIKNEVIKAMAFNMDLESFIKAMKKLREILMSREYTDEEELYPDLFSG